MTLENGCTTEGVLEMRCSTITPARVWEDMVSYAVILFTPPSPDVLRLSFFYRALVTSLLYISHNEYNILLSNRLVALVPIINVQLLFIIVIFFKISKLKLLSKFKYVCI